MLFGLGKNTSLERRTLFISLLPANIQDQLHYQNPNRMNAKTEMSIPLITPQMLIHLSEFWSKYLQMCLILSSLYYFFSKCLQISALLIQKSYMAFCCCIIVQNAVVLSQLNNLRPVFLSSNLFAELLFWPATTCMFCLRKYSCSFQTLWEALVNL